jgi:alkaline phosphatase D
MRRSFLFFLLFFAASCTVAGQHLRSMPDSTLAPFYHGVASGDPLADRVIIWTRLSLPTPDTQAVLNWRIATDTLLQELVGSGVVTTNADRDFTVKVDVTGLQPNTWYYYQFNYQGSKSLTGRTRTLPEGPVDRLRLAVMSCSDYQNGYYHAYRDMAQRNQLDLAIHLGDYIYEYGAASTLIDRLHEPAAEIITVADYRLRHSLYKLDPDLRALHQQLPVIAVWDDHETANNAWTDGAQNHQSATEGDWQTRKKAGKQVYMEWMPIRENAVAPDQIYRRFQFGDLMSLYMLDTRLEGRNVQLMANDPQINNPDRTLISQEQFTWLTDGIRADSARWVVLGQQVMMAPLQAFGVVLNTDQWDGYPAQRRRLYDFFEDEQVRNAVVLTGDIHTAWANDLPLDNYVPATGDSSAAVEFVTTSVTSTNLSAPVSPAFIQGLNPHVKFVDLQGHGYFVLDLTVARAQAEFVIVSDIKVPNFTSQAGPVWATLHGSRRLSPGLLSPPPVYPPLAPATPQVGTAVKNLSGIVQIVAAPNPFYEQVVLQFALQQAESVQITLVNSAGRAVINRDLGRLQAGVHHVHFDGTALPNGYYHSVIRTVGGLESSKLIKIGQ